MSESDRLLMKSKPAPSHEQPNCANLIQSHWFNTEAIMGHNFGQGDDHSPINPMHDPRLLASLAPQAPHKSTAVKA
jgi:hypothetical protein